MNQSIKTIVAGAAIVVGAAFVFAAPAAENWENHCAKCHGADGRGQTKVGKKLNVKDYTKADVQAKMKDDEMFKVISDGVIENGKEKKKPFKGELSEQEIKELVAYVRKFKA
jgi:cytochrome c6